MRHPEKAHRADNPPLRKPPWLRVRRSAENSNFVTTSKIVRDHGLATVCEAAACPNIGECWESAHATFMIMGKICTRACAFCNVATGVPSPLATDEPARIAAAIAKLHLRHAVITSVDRDDLPDGGAAHFSATIKAVRATARDTTIEILTPDFLRKDGALEQIAVTPPDVFNHNLETVPSLYPHIRPGARYYHSLRLLERAKTLMPGVFTKSGIMLGLGESRTQILQVMDDMRSAKIDFITLGQYLQPTRKHAAVARFVPPEEFDALAVSARSKGFLMVASAPLVRSSYHADDAFAALKRAL